MMKHPRRSRKRPALRHRRPRKDAPATLAGKPIDVIGKAVQVMYRDKAGALRVHSFRTPPRVGRVRGTKIIIVHPVNGTNELEG